MSAKRANKQSYKLSEYCASLWKQFHYEMFRNKRRGSIRSANRRGIHVLRLGKNKALLN
jgi:hypothetical protein